MNLVTYLQPGHLPRLGAVINSQIFDLAAINAALADIPPLPSTMMAFLAMDKVGLSIAQIALDRTLSLN